MTNAITTPANIFVISAGSTGVPVAGVPQVVVGGVLLEEEGDTFVPPANEAPKIISIPFDAGEVSSDVFSLPFAVIMAGGEGSRLAPLSSPTRPKQFLNIVDAELTMVQQTYNRVRGLIPPERIIVATNQSYEQLVREQLPEVPQANIISELCGQNKNTAPQIALISQMIYMREPEATVIFLPADHYINDVSAALAVFDKAVGLANQSDFLVTFGVPPLFASEDYGYIKVATPIDGEASLVDSFVEKPAADVAETFFNSGEYFWNSGVLVGRAPVILEAVREYLPRMSGLLEDMEINSDGSVANAWLVKYFNDVEGISIDHGVMERAGKAGNVAVLPFSVGWSDVGTWKGLKNLVNQFGIKLPESVIQYLKGQ